MEKTPEEVWKEITAKFITGGTFREFIRDVLKNEAILDEGDENYFRRAMVLLDRTLN